jgi:chemotaxis protein CheY-P-specific phosphatase CheC
MNETTEIMNETPVAVEENKYTFRKLEARDIAPVLGILRKIGFKEFKVLLKDEGIKKIIGVFMAGEKMTDGEMADAGLSAVFELVGIICENLPKAEKDIFALLASVSGNKPEHVEHMSLADFTEMLIEFFKLPDFPDFFKVVSKLFK